MEVFTHSGRQEASIGKLRAQTPTPLSCGDWDTVHFEPRAKRENEQKRPIGYTDEDSVIVVQRGRKEKGAYRPHTVC